MSGPREAHAGAPPLGGGPKDILVSTLLDHGVVRDGVVLAGERGLGRKVTRFNVMSVPHVVRWVKPDEFLLVTGYPMPREPVAIAELLRDLDRAGVAGVGVKFDQWLTELPEAARRVADEIGLPVVAVPPTVAFDDILSQGLALVTHRHADVLADVQRVHARLLDVSMQGGGLESLVNELANLLAGPVAFCNEVGVVLEGSAGAVEVLARLSLLDDAGRVFHDLGNGEHLTPDADRRWASQSVREGAVEVGQLLFLGTGVPLPPTVGPSLHQGAVVAALLLARDREVAAVTRQFASNVLYALLRGGPEEEEAADAAIQARGSGVELDDVQSATGFELLVADDLGRLPEPTAEELTALSELRGDNPAVAA
jgi:purine catabolism regulator